MKKVALIKRVLIAAGVAPPGGSSRFAGAPSRGSNRVGWRKRAVSN